MRLFWLLSTLLLLTVTPAFGQQRFALLIGNGAYGENVGILKNPVNDIKLIGEALTALKFDKVTIVPNADFSAIHKAIGAHARLVAAAGPGTISFVYYSGHGAADASTGTNYIIPIDVKDSEASTLWENSIALKGDILDKLAETAPQAIHYVVFDACRNELRLKMRDKKVLTVDGKAFVPIGQTGGIFVAYATAPGQTASDSGEGSGPYARILAEELVRPGVEAITMFRNIQLRVKQSQGQEPWLGPIPGISAFYFAGEKNPELKELDDPQAAFERERHSIRGALATILEQLKSDGMSPSGIVKVSDRWPAGARVGICFLDGPQIARVKVAAIARQWTLYGNIDFDFGNWEDPRSCSGSGSEDVRITFKEPGSWSFIGIQSKTNVKVTEPSMSLEGLDESDAFEGEWSRLQVIHEFGHVLGFDHNFTTTSTDCEAEMDWKHIYETLGGPPNLWDKETIDRNIRPRANGTDSVALDRKSVMNYELPSSFFLKGKESRCWLEPRAALSLRDKLAVFVNYP